MTNNVNTANKKLKNRFGMVTRGDHAGANIEFAACTDPKQANKRPLMNRPRWLRAATPTAMTKPEAAEWLLKNAPALKLFIEDMGKDDGYTEEQVMKCLTSVSAKNASATVEVDWNALLGSNDEAAEG